MGSDSPSFGIPSVMSTVFLRHATQRFALFGSIAVPQSAQRTRCMAGDGINSIVDTALEWLLVSNGELGAVIRSCKNYLI